MKGALFFIALAGAAVTQAAPFGDPFRPPRQLEPALASAQSTAPAPTRLESILIGPDRRIAVINGQQYAEGQRFGDGRVLRISESEVLIRRADRDETLTLFPDGGKRAAAVVKGGR